MTTYVYAHIRPKQSNPEILTVEAESPQDALAKIYQQFTKDWLAPQTPEYRTLNLLSLAGHKVSIPVDIDSLTSKSGSSEKTTSLFGSEVETTTDLTFQQIVHQLRYSSPDFSREQISMLKLVAAAYMLKHNQLPEHVSYSSSEILKHYPDVHVDSYPYLDDLAVGACNRSINLGITCSVDNLFKVYRHSGLTCASPLLMQIASTYGTNIDVAVIALLQFISSIQGMKALNSENPIAESLTLLKSYTDMM